MKGLKILGFVVGGLFLLGLVLIGLAFTSPVQTWAVRRVLAGSPGTTVEIGRVAAGLSGARLENVRYAKDGVVVTSPEISMRGSTLAIARGGRIDIAEFTAREVVIDASKAAPAKSAGPSTPGAFAGAFKLAQLPFEVRIAKVTVNGKALLPSNRTATFTVSGGGIQTGGEGQVDFKVDYTDGTAAAPIAAAHGTSRAIIHIAADRRVDALKLAAEGSLEGPNLPAEKFAASLRASQSQAGADESYAIELGIVRAESFEPIVTSNATYRNTSRDFSGDWKIALRSEQLAGVLKAFSLPPVAVTGAGRLEYSPAKESGLASGELTADVSKLETYNPALAALGSARLKTGFDLQLANKQARLERAQVEVFAADGRRLAEVIVLQKASYDLAAGKLASFDANADLARVSIQQLPIAWAQPFLPATLKIEAGDLAAAFAVRATSDGARVQARAVQPLTVQNLRVRNGDKVVADRISLTVTPQLEYAGDRMVAELPDLSVSSPDGDSLAGKIGATLSGLKTDLAAVFSASLKGRAAGSALGYLPVSTGPLAVAIEVDGRYEKESVQLQKLDAEVRRDGGGAVILAAKAAQPLRADLKQARLYAENPALAAVTLQLGELPLGWIQPFVKDSQFAGTVSGGAVQLFAEANGTTTVRSTTPVSVKGATVTLASKPILKGLDLTTDLVLTRREKSISYEFKALEAQEAGRSILKAQSAGEVVMEPKFAITGKGTLEADVAALGHQPVLATLATLSRGTVSATFDATSGETLTLDAKVTARNLVLRDGNRDAGSVDASVAFVSKPDGSATVKAPVVLVVGTRRSDVLLDGSLGASIAGVRKFSGKISGDQIVADDLMGLAAIGSSGNTSTPAPTTGARPATAPAPIVADTAPFWKGIAGQVTTEFKQVRYGTDYLITGVRGGLVIAENKLTIDGFEGKYGNDPYTLTGAVTFTPRQPRPYGLTGRANVSNVDVGAIMRAVNPNEPPAIESRVTVAANLVGDGRTANDLMQRVRGKFDLTGGSGVMRALGRKGQAVGALSGLLGIAGALQGSDTTSAIAELTSFFNAAPFDKITISAERGEDLVIKLTSIEVIHSSYRLTGSGIVTHQNDGPITSQPMSLKLQLGTKDRMAFLFNRAGLLQQKQDEKGYTLLNRDFSVTGTPAKTDAGDFWRFILEATVRAASGLLGR